MKKKILILLLLLICVAYYIFTLKLEFKFSPNFSERTSQVDTVILHASIEELDLVKDTFMQPQGKRSAHYSVSRTGEIVQHVDESKAAWHAGISSMPDGRSSVNNFSIGIELINLNDGKDPYPPAQVEALKTLLRKIKSRHPIKYLLTHAEVAFPAGRKSDPIGFDFSQISEFAEWRKNSLLEYTLSQAQSFLSEFNGLPVFSANWGGRFRPYLFEEGQLKPFLVPEPAELKGIDLYSPLATESGSLLMTGSSLGSSEFDIFLIDPLVGALNLTDSVSIDEGDICISPDKKSFSFRSGSDQIVRRVENPRDDVIFQSDRGFNRCIWASNESLIGYKRESAGFKLVQCIVTETAMQCADIPNLEDFEKFTEFNVVSTDESRITIGFIARMKNSQHYRHYFLENNFKVRENSIPGYERTDVLGVQGEMLRLGNHSQYYLSGQRGRDDVVYVFRKFQAYIAGISSSYKKPKTFAIFENGKWKYFYPSGVDSEWTASKPEEVWISSKASQESYQSYLFKTNVKVPDKKTVIWLHGGPYENVSPRYNAYFEALNRQGFDVLAFNYPGSSGRGRDYEKKFEERELLESLHAAVNYLKEQNNSKIFIWSISAGSRLTKLMIKNDFPVAAYIDQAGGPQEVILKLKEEKSARVLIVRGRNDHLSSENGVDYLYDGGHDITVNSQLKGLVSEAVKFMY